MPKVELPAGGHLDVSDEDEVELWNETARRYVEDFDLVRTNDLQHLGVLLHHTLTIYRAQRTIAAEMSKPEDDQKDAVITRANSQILKASEQQQQIEKVLGIDKKSRESGGAQNLKEYLARAKRAAHAKGLRISERVLWTEALIAELSWRVRLLDNGDDEDRMYHHVSETTIIDYLRARLAEYEDKEQEWAREHGAIVVGVI